MFTALFGLTLGFAVTDWVSSWRGWRALRWVAKPGTLLLLIAWFTQAGGWQGRLIWFGAGLVFSLFGDVLLMLPKSFFLPGVGAFFLAHVAYIIGFLQPPLELRWEMLIPLALVGELFWLLSRRICAGLRQHGETGLLGPVIAYSLVLSLMWLAALNTLLRPGWASIPAFSVSLGAGLFFLSDSTLAYNRFVRPLPAADLAVMVTYHAGQILIAIGALQQFA